MNTLLKTSSLLLLATHALPTLSLAGGHRCEPDLRHRILDLGVVAGRQNSFVMSAQCLNEGGQVVGWSNDGPQYAFENDTAFVWSPREHLRPLTGLPGAATTVAIALNDRGQAVGFSGEPFPLSKPVVWGRRGVQALGVPTGFLGGMAYAINQRGEIAGALISQQGGSKAVVWENGQPVFLPLAGASPQVQGWCYGMNNRGHIVGMNDFKPALWVRGELAPPETFGDTPGQANAINDRGQVVGFTYPGGGAPQAFVWDDGEMTSLTTDEAFTVALSINNRSQIVGVAGAGNAGGDAALWHRGQRILLADTLPPGSDWILLEADCINDRGQITGFGIHQGQTRAFLLTPRD